MERKIEPIRLEVNHMDWVAIAIEVVGGLVLFLLSLLNLRRRVQPVAPDRLPSLPGRFTTNRFVGVLSGLVATTLLDSSPVTIILLIALVNGGLLTFPQALGIIFGSNDWHDGVESVDCARRRSLCAVTTRGSIPDLRLAAA